MRAETRLRSHDRGKSRSLLRSQRWPTFSNHSQRNLSWANAPPQDCPAADELHCLRNAGSRDEGFGQRLRDMAHGARFGAKTRERELR